MNFKSRLSKLEAEMNSVQEISRAEQLRIAREAVNRGDRMHRQTRADAVAQLALMHSGTRTHKFASRLIEARDRVPELWGAT